MLDTQKVTMNSEAPKIVIRSFISYRFMQQQYRHNPREARILKKLKMKKNQNNFTN